SPPEGDGLAPATPGLALGILTADCAPVLFADSEAGVIGAAHAGWKGALGGVTDSAIAAMERLGARRGRVAGGGRAVHQSSELGTRPRIPRAIPARVFPGPPFRPRSLCRRATHGGQHPKRRT